MHRLRALWQRRFIASALAAALGIALVAISEFGGVHELRVFGALLISFGGIGFGLDAGLTSTDRWSFLKRLLEWRVALAVLGTAVMTIPILVALVAALFGLFGDAADRDSALLGIGAFVVAFMLAATLLTGGFAIRSVAAAARNEPGIGQDQQPVERPR
jgi:hypothetical protein